MQGEISLFKVRGRQVANNAALLQCATLLSTGLRHGLLLHDCESVFFFFFISEEKNYLFFLPLLLEEGLNAA